MDGNDLMGYIIKTIQSKPQEPAVALSLTEASIRGTQEHTGGGGGAVTAACYLMYLSLEVSGKLTRSLSSCMEVNQPCEPPKEDSLGTWAEVPGNSEITDRVVTRPH